MVNYHFALGYIKHHQDIEIHEVSLRVILRIFHEVSLRVHDIPQYKVKLVLIYTGAKSNKVLFSWCMVQVILQVKAPSWITVLVSFVQAKHNTLLKGNVTVQSTSLWKLLSEL